MSDLGLWAVEGFPHRGWECIDVVDLNPDNRPAREVDYSSCEVCGQYPVRFVHHLVHDDWDEELEVGRICAEHLTADYINPKRREAELLRRASARARWAHGRWRRSAKGNAWRRVKGHHIVVLPAGSSEGWTFSVDGVFSRRTFDDERAAKLASYDGYEYMSRRPRGFEKERPPLG